MGWMMPSLVWSFPRGHLLVWELAAALLRPMQQLMGAPGTAH